MCIAVDSQGQVHNATAASDAAGFIDSATQIQDTRNAFSGVSCPTPTRLAPSTCSATACRATTLREVLRHDFVVRRGQIRAPGTPPSSEWDVSARDHIARQRPKH